MILTVIWRMEISFNQRSNPRTYTQIHTPAVVQGVGRLMEPLLGFLIFCSISKRFNLQRKRLIISTRWGTFYFIFILFRIKHGGVTENVLQTLDFALVGFLVKFHPTGTAGERIIRCSYKEFKRIYGYSLKPVVKCILLKQIKE